MCHLATLIVFLSVRHLCPKVPRLRVRDLLRGVLGRRLPGRQAAHHRREGGEEEGGGEGGGKGDLLCHLATLVAAKGRDEAGHPEGALRDGEAGGRTDHQEGEEAAHVAEQGFLPKNPCGGTCTWLLLKIRFN